MSVRTVLLLDGCPRPDPSKNPLCQPPKKLSLTGKPKGSPSLLSIDTVWCETSNVHSHHRHTSNFTKLLFHAFDPLASLDQPGAQTLWLVPAAPNLSNMVLAAKTWALQTLDYRRHKLICPSLPLSPSPGDPCLTKYCGPIVQGPLFFFCVPTPGLRGIYQWQIFTEVQGAAGKKTFPSLFHWRVGRARRNHTEQDACSLFWLPDEESQ